MRLLIGCPVRDRAWIMPRWFEHVEAALERARLRASFVFVAPAGDETEPVIYRHGPARCLVLHSDEGDQPERGWADEARVRHLVDLRNRLLRHVRAAGPDAYLSLDSDVLLAPEAIADLVESLGSGRFGAVGGATFMSALHDSPGVPASQDFPSCGWVRGMDGFQRQAIEHRGVIPVGVIMAVKMMSPRAYWIDYQLRREGEDVGWSLACEAAGVRLGWDNRHPSKHVMARHHLDRVDERCGF